MYIFQQILHAHGVPDERIIVFMRDDIANNEENPKKGSIINRPGGPNVYPGVPKDYVQDDYTIDNFWSVMAGDNTTNNGKTLNSGPNDNVFIGYFDHGGPGISGLGDDVIKADRLNKVRTVFQL